MTEIQVKYFDTLALANSLCVLKTGFLFVASEFGNHALYQFTGPRPVRCPMASTCVVQGGSG